MMVAPKKKWTGRYYGHEQVVDQAVLEAKSVVQYNPRSVNRYALIAIVFVVGIFFFLAADSFLQSQRFSVLNAIQATLSQKEWGLNVGLDEAQFNVVEYIEGRSTIRNVVYHDLQMFPSEIGFFSDNGFYLSNNNGVVYINPTSLAGRAIPSMAKRFQVAIILRGVRDFNASDVIKVLGMEVLEYEKFEKSNVTYLEMTIPAQHWLWFSRYVSKTLL